MPVSIRSRLLLLVLSVLLPAVAAALWLIGQTFDAEQRAVERNLRDSTRALSLVVDRELAQRAAIARVLALSHLLDDGPAMSPAQLAGFEQQARRAMQGLGGWVELRSPGGRLLSTQRAPVGGMAAGTMPTGATLAAVAGADRGAGDPTATATAKVAGADRDANAATAIPTAIATAAATTTATDLPWSDLPTVAPLARPADGGTWQAAAVQPVQRDGRTLLNVVVTILPAELQNVVDQQRLPAGWVGTVIDSGGTVVARCPGGAAFAGRAATVDLKARMAAASEGLFDTASLDGVPVRTSFSTAPQGWRYAMEVPRGELGASLPAAVLQVGTGAALLLALAVGAALWVSRRIVEPVLSLKRAATRLHAGLPVDYLPTGIAECDEVGAALAEAGAAMGHARAELERRIADAVARTREAEQRVARNQRVEALGRLTGGVAHDFNNLLGVISNSAYLIQRQAADPALQTPVAATLRAVETGSRLTRQLLRFSGRQQVHPQAVELTTQLPEVHELLKTVLGKRIESTVWVAPKTSRVSVDASELELSLINLALNARDAMPSGGKVWVKARDAEPYDTAGLPPGRYVLITVSDDGAGVSPEVAQRAFEPFFTTKSVGEGSGLGLSQVHGFCGQAGGTARLASTPGLGTTVSMVLPAHDDAVAADEGPQVVTGGDGIAGKRVLLVEDNDELGDVTAALLELYGCTVQRARSALEALAQVTGEGDMAAPAADRFDVVLSDVVMPGGMDGVALARTLRSHLPALPVVLISGYNTALAGARDFVALRKPCTPEDLLATLRRAMSEPPGSAAVDPAAR